MSSHLLACECGITVTITTGDAGVLLTCPHCNAAIRVPELENVRQLPIAPDVVMQHDVDYRLQQLLLDDCGAALRWCIMVPVFAIVTAVIALVALYLRPAIITLIFVPIAIAKLRAARTAIAFANIHPSLKVEWEGRLSLAGRFFYSVLALVAAAILVRAAYSQWLGSVRF